MEKKYGERLVVIGVHSAKFPTEKVTENIRHAAARYNLKHPIANDAAFKIWDRFGVRAWPTMVLIDTEGRYVGERSGEGHFELFDKAIGRLLEEAGQKVEAQPLSPALPPAPEREGGGFLRYPGKVAVGGEPARLFITDTGHHRIVAVDFQGKVLEIYGDVERGLRDGPPAQARFHDPQGLWAEGGTLYVADTRNHAIRAVDLRSGAVRTLAGTGEQADFRSSGGKARETPLNSPWDVLHHDGKLIIAMAGSHQVWRLDLAREEVAPWIGSGREDIVDGSAAEAELAQPSGLALSGKRLYIADSESSGVRVFDLETGRLATLVGTGLFDFGDGEGKGGRILQHPLAVAVVSAGDGEEVIIADSYNHRLKRLDPRTGSVRFWLGSGKPGAGDGERPSFYEPSGLALHGGKVYVADTNNHQLRVVDLKSGATTTLKVEGKLESKVSK